MIRCSYGLHSKDEMFLENVNGAQAVGLKVGALTIPKNTVS